VINAILLCGKDSDPSKFSGTYKYNLSFFGKVTVLDNVLKALENAISIGSVYIVGSGEDIEENSKKLEKVIEIIPESEPSTLVGNLRKGIQSHRRDSDKGVLVVSSDLPFLNPQTLDAFVLQCQTGDADIYVPLVSEQAFIPIKGIYEPYFRPMQEFSFRDGSVVYFTNPEIVLNGPLADRIDLLRESMDKSAIGKLRLLYQLVGIRGAVALGINAASLTMQSKSDYLNRIVPFSGVFGISDYELMISNALDCKVKFVPMHEPQDIGLCVDVDSHAKYELLYRGYYRIQQTISSYPNP